MRPGNYAHERWPDVSLRITALKNRHRGRYYRLHEHDRTVCFTRSQAQLYDNLMSYREEGDIIDIVGNNIKFNSKTLMILIDIHKLFALFEGKLYILK
jgi:hypothetical protein